MDLLSYKKESKNSADVNVIKNEHFRKWDLFQFSINEAIELKKMEVKEVNLGLSIAIYEPYVYNHMVVKLVPEVAKKGIILLEGFKFLTYSNSDPIVIDLISLVNDEVINPGTVILQGWLMRANDFYEDTEERDELNTIFKNDKYLDYRRGRNKEEQDNPPRNIVVTEEMLKDMEDSIREANRKMQEGLS